MHRFVEIPGLTKHAHHDAKEYFVVIATVHYLFPLRLRYFGLVGCILGSLYN
jgi:hypothetical protein